VADFTQTKPQPINTSMLLSGHSSVLMGNDLNIN